MGGGSPFSAVTVAAIVDRGAWYLRRSVLWQTVVGYTFPWQSSRLIAAGFVSGPAHDPETGGVTNDHTIGYGLTKAVG